MLIRCHAIIPTHASPPPGRPAQVHTREEVRGQYGIRGDAYNDCLTVWCCRARSLTQERREIELEEGTF
jgi:Cys-rich protein (TIGR01571 family)